MLAGGLSDPTCLRADGGRLLVAERGAGRITAISSDGATSPVLTGLTTPAALDRLGEGYVVSAGHVVLLIDGQGNERRLDGFGDAQGVASNGNVILVADAGRHEIIAFDVASGSREVIVSGAPIGVPVQGTVPAAFTPLTSDGVGGFLVGCNGDGSIRRLTRA